MTRQTQLDSKRQVYASKRKLKWLLPIVVALAPLIDRETIVVTGILWSLGLMASLAFGREVLQSTVLSLLVALCLSLIYLEIEGRLVTIPRPHGALAFGGGCLGLAVLSFAGDCLVGSLHAPGAPWQSACTENAGIGFLFTLLLVAVGLGVPVVGLLRFAVSRLWNR
jgi:hypothetical protein